MRKKKMVVRGIYKAYIYDNDVKKDGCFYFKIVDAQGIGFTKRENKLWLGKKLGVKPSFDHPQCWWFDDYGVSEINETRSFRIKCKANIPDTHCCLYQEL